MEQKEILITLKAIEFMSYGIDISKFTTVDEFKGYVNSNTKQYISRLSPTVTDFIWELEDRVKNFFGLYASFVVRHEKSFSNLERDDDEDGLIGDRPSNIVVTYDMVIKTMQQLFKQGICRYRSIDEELLDPELQSRLDKIDAEFNRKVAPDNEMTKALSKDAIKKNFEILTAVAYQKCPAVRDKMLDAFNVKRNSFDIKGLEDYPIVDERLYIPLSEADIYRIKKHMKDRGSTYHDYFDDMKYIVISKNLYDYYFCSYGSDFQSCFSLTSTHLGWYGMLPMGTVEGHYMIYGTKDKPNKTAILGDNHKWATPYMFFRCWGWTAQNGALLLDKGYTSSNNFYQAVKDVVLSKYMSVDVDRLTQLKNSNEFKELFDTHSLRFYPDSIKTDSFRFKVLGGDREFKGRNMPYYGGIGDRPVSRVLTSITNVKDSFNPYKDMTIIDGMLLNPKKCPVTGLIIDESESQSKYAKYLNNPVEGKFMVVTYCDGGYKYDAVSTDRVVTSGTLMTCQASSSAHNNEVISFANWFSNPSSYNMSLKTFKERLKGGINKSEFDLVLLRVIEDDKVTYIKYKKQGVKA